jgi:hypothetical protein
LVTFATIRRSGKVHDLVGRWRYDSQPTGHWHLRVGSRPHRPSQSRHINPQLLKADKVDVEGSRGHITAASGSKLWRLSSRVESALAMATDSEPSHLSLLRFVVVSERFMRRQWHSGQDPQKETELAHNDHAGAKLLERYLVSSPSSTSAGRLPVPPAARQLSAPISRSDGTSG